MYTTNFTDQCVKILRNSQALQRCRKSNEMLPEIQRLKKKNTWLVHVGKHAVLGTKLKVYVGPEFQSYDYCPVKNHI